MRKHVLSFFGFLLALPFVPACFASQVDKPATAWESMDKVAFAQPFVLAKHDQLQASRGQSNSVQQFDGNKQLITVHSGQHRQKNGKHEVCSVIDRLTLTKIDAPFFPGYKDRPAWNAKASV